MKIINIEAFPVYPHFVKRNQDKSVRFKGINHRTYVVKIEAITELRATATIAKRHLQKPKWIRSPMKSPLTLYTTTCTWRLEAHV